MNKILFVISLAGLIFSSLFTIVSIWNTEWMLLERGYYTFGIITVIASLYICVQLLLGVKNTGNLGKLNLGISVIFSFIAIVFMAISIRNTEWILLEKGYYWMGLAFVAICSAMVSTTVSSVVSDDSSNTEREY